MLSCSNRVKLTLYFCGSKSSVFPSFIFMFTISCLKNGSHSLLLHIRSWDYSKNTAVEKSSNLKFNTPMRKLQRQCKISKNCIIWSKNVKFYLFVSSEYISMKWTKLPTVMTNVLRCLSKRELMNSKPFSVISFTKVLWREWLKRLFPLDGNSWRFYSQKFT